MKKVIVILLMLLMIGSLWVYAQKVSFKDVPVNHWAYDAVMRLAVKGIVQGMPDQTFRGNNAMTRYAAAVMLDKTIQYMEKDPKLAKAEDIGILENLVDKITAELGNITADLGGYNKTIKSIQGTTNSNAEAIGVNAERLVALKGDLSALKESVTSMKGSIDDLMAAQKTGIGSVKESLSKEIASAKQYLLEIINQEDARITGNMEAVASLGDEISKVKASQNKFANKEDLVFLWKKTDEVSKKVDAMKSLRTDLEGELANVRNEAQGMMAVIDGKTVKNADAVKALEDSLMAKLQNTNKSISDLQLNTEANAEITASLAGKITANQDALAKVDKAISDAKDSLNTKISTLNNKMNYQVGKLNKKVSANADAVKSLQDSLNLNNETVISMFSQVQLEYDSYIKALSSKIDKNAASAVKFASLNNHMIAENTKKIADLNKKIVDLNKNVARNSSDVETVKKTAESANSLAMTGIIIGVIGAILGVVGIIM